MAYLLTAITTGGVAAILSLLAGAGAGEIFLNYVIYGHLGMAVMATALLARQYLPKADTD
ncbi:hypothetical protein [Sulfitobacter sp. S190]|uniref:hypothetical protein n=1 Tax=Sulfitobacter sp. S190 TaxID=2867022 RepID=UPI0021A56315|nr:hypothetical protein [Sulfitobacter sp. S190]UWR21002.1 hypothetical protein K3756_09730 [Sulfitobacter sp. S190]